MRLRNLMMTILTCLPVMLPAQTYLWPTDASRALTSSFAESRPGRFHAGIDVKTWGRTGYPIFAVRSGHVSRIRVSPFGYGRALYLTLDTGEVVVYAHLDHFNQELEDYVWDQQQQRGRYGIQLWCDKSLFPVQQGDVLGMTGDTGIGYPHLHFEMRDASNRPINPLSKGYELDDTVPPVLSRISATPLDAWSRVNGDWKPQIVRLHRTGRGQYQIPDTLEVQGRVALGLSAYDQMDGIYNKFGTYINELQVDGRTVFRARYERFSYSQNHHAKLDRDYRLQSRGLGLFYVFYRDQGNTLPFYDGREPYYGVMNARVGEAAWEIPPPFNSSEALTDLQPGVHTVTIHGEDFWGNQSTASGWMVVRDVDDAPAINPFVTDTGRTPGGDWSFEVTPTFYDRHLRLELTAPEPFSRLPVVHGWQGDGRKRSVDLIWVDDRTVAGGWDLTQMGEGDLAFEITLVDSSGDSWVQTTWIDATRVRAHSNAHIVSDDGHCRLEFSRRSLFKDLFVRVHAEEAVTPGYETVGLAYRLEPDDMPMDRGATVSLACPPTDSLPSTLGIYQRRGENKWSFVGNSYSAERGMFSARVRSFGTYTLVRDTEPPRLSALYPGDGTVLTDRTPELGATFRDTLSGISGEDNRVMLLDGRRVIAEYDPESRTLLYQVRTSLAPGMHRVEIRLQDRSGNTTRRQHVFEIQ